MTNAQLYSQIQRLPESLRQQVSDFVEFLSNKQKELPTGKREFGCAKGLFKMSSDFDDPFEDLKEYMY